MADVMNNDSGPHFKARQTLLLHATKSDMDWRMANHLFRETSKLMIIEEVEEEENHVIWKNIAGQVFNHKQVRNKFKFSISDYKICFVKT